MLKFDEQPSINEYSRVDCVFIIYKGAVTMHVKCPNCGMWGRASLRNRNTYCVIHGHKIRTRCSTTNFNKFQIFIERIAKILYHIRASVLIAAIRRNQLPINIPVIDC